MPSQRKLAANRAHARKSTGPRTVSGKRRAAGNARRHGLATRLIFDLELTAKLAVDVDELAGNTADPHIRVLARRVVEANLELQRVKAVQTAFLDRLEQVLCAERHVNHTRIEDVAGTRLENLRRLDRYATRAYGRRDKAVCAFLRAQSSATCACE